MIKWVRFFACAISLTGCACMLACADDDESSGVPTSVATLDELLKVDCVAGDTFNTFIREFDVQAYCRNGVWDTSEVTATFGSIYDSVNHTLTDLRNNYTYKTGTFGNHVWMLENLNFKPHDYDYDSPYSLCSDDSEENCKKYGRHYASKALNEGGYCPKGWRLPSNSEMLDLMAYACERWETNPNVGYLSYCHAVRYLKSTEGWLTNDSILPGLDSLGLHFLPAGVYYDLESYGFLGVKTSLWSQNGFLTIDTNIVYFNYHSSVHRASYYSVRCILDDSVSQSYKPKMSTFTDPRSEREFKTTIIGKQEWMAENMRRIPDETWCYENSYDSCDVYGGLYTWDEAMDVPPHYFDTTVVKSFGEQGICPEGWRIPSLADVKELIAYTQSQGLFPLGRLMKDDDSWVYSPERAGTGGGLLGFSLPAGGYGYKKSDNEYKFTESGHQARFWLRDGGYLQDKVPRYMYVRVTYDENHVKIVGEEASRKYSVRCLRDVE